MHPTCHNIAGVLANHARRRPSHPAIVSAEGTVRYGELDLFVRQRAAFLMQSGVGPGDVVGVCLRDRTEHVLLLYAIAAVDRVDCLYIGRIDLTVALGKTDPNDPVVVDAVASICNAGQKANTAIGMFVTDVAEAKQWQDHGASLFLLQSDQAFLLAGAAKLAAAFR